MTNETTVSDGGAGAGSEPWRAMLGPFVGWFFAGALVTIGANLALREFPGLPLAVRALLVLASVPPLILMIVSGLRVLRRMDELERRIQLEALGCAFGVLGLLLVGYGQAQTAFRLTPEPWTMVWPLMYAIYAGCLVLVRRRYQ
jgi:hypothetical protein